MEGGAPRWILIHHDDYAAKHIGRTSNGNQFFLTTPFEPAIGTNPGCEFIALFIIDNNGVLLEAKIDKLGPRSEVDKAAAHAKYDQRLAELGKVTFEQIKVEPFEIERFGIKFGLILQSREDGGWKLDCRTSSWQLHGFFHPGMAITIHNGKCYPASSIMPLNKLLKQTPRKGHFQVW